MKYVYHIICVIALFFLSDFCICAANIKGIVLDAETKESLVGVTVQLATQPTLGTSTSLDGSFSLTVSQLPAELIFSYIGYDTKKYTVTDERENLIINLVPTALALGEVVVMGDGANTDAGARNIERTSMNVMNVISAKAIEVSPDMTVANVVQRISGVTIERNNSGDGQYALLRGMDKRYNYTLINGIKIPSPHNKNRFVPLDIFPSELLDRLEVTKALTADMEGDAVGGVVNMEMKDAPVRRQLTANISTGYNALFLDRDFLSFDHSNIDKKSAYEIYGPGYAAKPRDFSTDNIRLQSGNAKPNLFAGLSYGDRFFQNHLGVMLAGSYQNSYRGSNSTFYNSKTATSDASNLPVLTDANYRTYSEQQTRYGIHLKLDYKINHTQSIQWYNAYMDFTNPQVRDNMQTNLSSGYNPSQGDYNLSYDTRFRINHQQIFNSTLKGKHLFFKEAFNVDWSAVYSKALNETPDNSSIHTATTVRGNNEMPKSVVTLGGADRRWEHNSDEDLAGYLNFRYYAIKGEHKLTFSVGGMYRDKQRTNFFNQYDFRPFDESKPEGMQNNLIKGVDWNSYDEIKFMVFTPYGAVGNPLNYDASEKIGAGYGMMDFSISNIHVTIGVRAENTNQGYNLKYAIEGEKNIGEQKYTDVLPSVHVKYSPMENSNIKASYFKSINRPGFFEIVPYRIINEEYTETGNPELEHTVVHNADVRFEYFPKSSEQMMLGLFYKKLYDPIEYGMVTQGQSSFYSPTNFGDAVNYGLEVDVIKYFRSFGVKANYTFTQSEITTTKLLNYDNPDPSSTDRILIKNVEQRRPLNGQAKHVANATLIYKNVNNGWDAQVSFSYTGDRMYAVSRFVDNDIWQGSYIQLDASIEKRFQFGLSIFAKASNLLDTPMTHYLKLHNPYNTNIDGYKGYKGGTLVRKDYYGQMMQIGCRYKF